MQATRPIALRLFEKGVASFRPSSSVEGNVQTWKDQCLAILEKYIDKATTHPDGFGLRKEQGFRELLQKDVGRFDLNLDHLMDDCLAFPEVKEHIFIGEVYNYVCRNISGVLDHTFGKGHYKLNAQGAVVSHPGTLPQRWHVDSSPLFPAQPSDSSTELLPYTCDFLPPCHFVTVFVPLYSATPDIGPTEFATGSHKCTSRLNSLAVEDQYPSDEVVSDILSAEGVDVVKSDVAAGDITIMDGRTLHRGLSNRTDELRPLLYFSFCKNWYYEFPRSQNEGRKLFP